MVQIFEEYACGGMKLSYETPTSPIPRLKSLPKLRQLQFVSQVPINGASSTGRCNTICYKSFL